MLRAVIHNRDEAQLANIISRMFLVIDLVRFETDNSHRIVIKATTMIRWEASRSLWAPMPSTSQPINKRQPSTCNLTALRI